MASLVADGNTYFMDTEDVGGIAVLRWRIPLFRAENKSAAVFFISAGTYYLYLYIGVV